MAAIAVANNLIEKGFRVKITSLLVVKLKNKTYHHLVPVKRFNQPMDMNAAAYVCGDPRFFRYQGFKMIMYGMDQDKEIILDGLGVIVKNIKAISANIEDVYVPNSNLKQADTRLYFGGSRRIDDVQKEVAQALDILNTKYGEKE